jgi:hypothetical protein
VQVIQVLLEKAWTTMSFRKSLNHEAHEEHEEEFDLLSRKVIELAIAVHLGSGDWCCSLILRALRVLRGSSFSICHATASLA